MNRWPVVAMVGLLCLLLPGGAMGPGRGSRVPVPFESWRSALIDEAVDRGFGRRFVEEALAAVRPLRRVVQLDRMQAEAPPDLDEYLKERVTPDLVARGREMMRTHAAALDRLERTFGVPRHWLVAIWGAETGYGSYTGNVPVLDALATLAWQPRRSAYFRAELFNALTILREGHISRDAMTGSWAGAMGQPQFMPSSFLQYAVDFDRDGRRDIWTSVADSLASIAHYLRRHGWEPGVDWGGEVALPPAARAPIATEIPMRSRGCGAMRVLTDRRSLDEWAARGVDTMDRDEGSVGAGAASLLTIGSRAFLVTPNYETILRYNCSHRYALSVSLLANQLR